MVTITNKLNLPEQIFKACLHDTHKVAGDISCSQLCENPRPILLKRTNDYEEDISTKLYALMGTALHHILERSNISNIEKRAFMTVLRVMDDKLQSVKDEGKREGIVKVINYITRFMGAMYPEPDDRYLIEVTQRFQIGDKVLYGTPDNFDKLTGILYDYKFCSVFMYTNPESQQKWEAQTNVYAWLLTQAGYEVKEIRIIAFFRDWSAQPFNKKKDYPDSQIKEISIAMRTPVEMLNYVNKRMDMHNKAEQTGILPLCSGKERWATSDMWAVKTRTAKKALRVDPMKEVCERFMVENDHRHEGMFLEFRPGVSNKCEKYCAVKEFCDQYKTEKEIRVKQSNDE
jgi:hypothetical protein